jgi:hypothetical protein
MKQSAVFCLIAIFTLCAFGQEPPATPPAGQERPGFPGQQTPEPKPYDRVITKDAKSDTGIFTVHRIKEKWYYEIPKSELNREFLCLMT